MGILTSIIHSLSKEEIRAYKLYAKRTNDTEGRKDIELFDLLVNKPAATDAEQAKRLYMDAALDAKYYKLKNRIADDLGLVLVNLNHKKSSIDTLYNVSLAKLFFGKKEYKLSVHYLKVAERKALEHEDYSLLDIIYELMIQYNGETLTQDPELLIHKRIENTQRLVLTQDLENNFAKLNYQLKVTQNFVIDEKLAQWLQKTIKSTRNLPYVKNSKTLRIKTFQNLIRLLVLVRDYPSLKLYLEESFVEFEKDKLFSQSNHSVKLELIVYLCNTNYILKNNKEAIKYANLLYAEMQKYSQLFANKYLFFYYNTLVNIYSEIDVLKAIGILEKSEKEAIIKANNDHYFYVLIQLASQHFNINKYKIAAKNISKIYINTDFKKLNPILKIKVMVFEIAIRIELREIDLCKKQVLLVTQLLNSVSEKETIKDEIDVISIIKLYLQGNKPNWANAKDQISHFLKSNPDYVGNGYLDYAVWLSDKLK